MSTQTKVIYQKEKEVQTNEEEDDMEISMAHIEKSIFHRNSVNLPVSKQDLDQYR